MAVCGGAEASEKLSWIGCGVVSLIVAEGAVGQIQILANPALAVLPLLFVALFPKFVVLIKLMMFCVGALVPVYRFEKVII